MQKLNYNELSSFLLKEAISLTKDLLEYMHENDGQNAFSFSGPERVIEEHARIGRYLKYASIAYDIWDPNAS